MAVETMLEEADRKLSNRYKLIDYREDDHQKTIIFFSSTFFAEVSIPVMLGIIGAQNFTMNTI